MVDRDSIIKLWEDQTESVALWEDLVIKSMPDLSYDDLTRVSCYMNDYSKKMSNDYNRRLSDGEMELVTGNLLVLSKIKDLSKIIFTNEECEDKEAKCSFESMDQIERLREWNIDARQMAFNAILGEVINEINKDIDNGKIIYVKNLIKSVSLIAEGTHAPVLILKMNVKCTEPNEKNI